MLSISERHNMKTDKTQRKEFSKIIILVTFCIFIFTLLIGCILAWNGKDTSIFYYAIPSTGGVVGSSVIFYYRKAQVENSVKLQIHTLEEMYQMKEKYQTQSMDINSVISCTESEIKNTISNYKNDGNTPVNISG